jgi:hypothetical protein
VPFHAFPCPHGGTHFAKPAGPLQHLTTFRVACDPDHNFLAPSDKDALCPAENIRSYSSLAMGTLGLLNKLCSRDRSSMLRAKSPRFSSSSRKLSRKT